MNRVLLKDISTRISSGVTPLRSNPDFWDSQDIPWVKTEQLGIKHIWDSNEKISTTALEKTSLKLNPVNSLSVAMYGEGRTRGSVSIFKKEVTTNQACCNIAIDNSKADYEYVYYFLKTQYNELRNLSSGVRKNLNSNDIKNFEIRLPSELNTQKKIAKVLANLDDKIELNNKINVELEAIAKLIYDYWFVQFDFPDVNGRPYKSSDGKMVYNEELKREIPDGWDVKQLHELLSFERGISYKSKEITEKGVPMINLNSFNLSGQYKSKGIKYFSGAYKENKVVSSGDLVIAITDVTRNADIIGKAFTIPDLFDEDILISCDVAKVVPSNSLNVQFLEPLFNSEQYHSYIKHFASGTLVLHLNLDGVNWCKIPLPPIEVLNKYSELRTDIDKKLTLAIKENKKLTELRDWLLPMLMNGQVTVK